MHLAQACKKWNNENTYQLQTQVCKLVCNEVCKYPKKYANEYANRYASKYANKSAEEYKQVYKHNKTMKIPSSSGIFKTLCNNGSYLLLFGKRNW